METARQELALCSDFNIRDVFRHLTKGDESGKVSSRNVEELMDLLAISANFRCFSQSLVDMYDADKDKELSLEEFVEVFAPNQREYRILLNCRIDKSKEELEIFKTVRNSAEFEIFEEKTKEMMKKLLIKLTHMVKFLNGLRKELAMSDSDLEQIFRIVDTDKDGKISDPDVSFGLMAAQTIFD
jgi:hypothetical protein